MRRQAAPAGSLIVCVPSGAPAGAADALDALTIAYFLPKI